jgi:hypothetical protein
MGRGSYEDGTLVAKFERNRELVRPSLGRRVVLTWMDIKKTDLGIVCTGSTGSGWDVRVWLHKRRGISS